ncbi:hypothetical protein BH24ACT20_BH24ACT20_10240 [soil metagenome]|jgi:uncharacterized protein YqgV (UPF0045/DUF77 family)
MPGYERAPVSAELKVVASDRAERPPREQIEAAKEAAGASGLAHEAAPDTMMLSGNRKEVLEATVKVMEAALDAGANAIEVKVEPEGDADRFQ